MLRQRHYLKDDLMIQAAAAAARLVTHTAAAAAAAAARLVTHTAAAADFAESGLLLHSRYQHRRILRR